MPASLECAGRAVADPVGLAIAIESRSSTVADVLACGGDLTYAESLADALSDTITEAVADSETFPNTQTLPGVEA